MSYLLHIAKIDIGKRRSEFSCLMANSPDSIVPSNPLTISESKLATEIEESSVEYILKITKRGLSLKISLQAKSKSGNCSSIFQT